jgi:hypothetical protein
VTPPRAISLPGVLASLPAVSNLSVRFSELGRPAEAVPVTQEAVDTYPTTRELKELDESLLARAMEHDSPTSLFRPAVHSTGQNSPLLGPGAAGLLKQVTSPAATLERPATRLFEVSRWGHLAWLADQATGPSEN